MLQRLQKLGAGLTRWTIRWVPDAWIVAILLTLLVWILAVWLGGAAWWVGEQPLPVCGATKSCGAFDAWSGGIWRLLKLSAQFALALVAAQACATSRPLYGLMNRLASLPDASRPRQAIVLMALFSALTAYLNWAVNLVMCAAFVPIVAARNPRTDWRLLVATAYLGIGVVWHGGLSGSAPLVAATADSFLIKQGILAQPLPISETLLAPFNLIYLVIITAVATTTMALLHPEAADTKALPIEQAEALVSPPGPRPSPSTPAERLNMSRLMSMAVGCLVLAHLVTRFIREGSGGWDINGYNAAFVGLALVLHDSPQSFLRGCEQGAKNAWGIIVQFPLYAGIFGLMTLTPLASQLSDGLASFGSAQSYPAVVYALSAMVNYLVPSGGSQFVIEAPYILSAGASHGLEAGATVLAFAYGDMSTNLIQPFWAIPLLSVTGVSFGEIMGYCLLLFAAVTTVTLGAVWCMPLFL
ncbi:MAG TPA: short-chain fatty acid transporter [Myxococcales bacterium]|nr:short-chain fatty acid transporter [Myxococcales bacterium]